MVWEVLTCTKFFGEHANTAASMDALTGVTQQSAGVQSGTPSPPSIAPTLDDLGRWFLNRQRLTSRLRVYGDWLAPTPWHVVSYDDMHDMQL
jgi:hypothetical protein